MNNATRQKIAACFANADPAPVTELKYTSSFELLIAVMLSAQMTDKGVNKVTQKLFPVACTPEAILALGEEKLSHYLKSINYYKTKSKHVIQTCERLIGHYQGQIPSTRKDLESLPGVGRKTANVILSIVFNAPVIAVDTHVFRVANRTGLAKSKTPRGVEEALLKTFPPEFLPQLHHWLILHGRYVCTARRPRCAYCIIKPYCEFTDKNL